MQLLAHTFDGSLATVMQFLSPAVEVSVPRVFVHGHDISLFSGTLLTKQFVLHPALWVYRN